MLPIPLLVVLLALFPYLAFGFSFNISNTPQQCQNLSISITGSGGQAPYNALIVPYGASTLVNNTEVRRIMTKSFDGNSTSLSFQLNYPENSQFVVVVSDSTGFGTGGTSVAAQVQTGSTDSSCYGTTQVSPDFSFSIVPANQLVQCADTRVWWDPAVVQGSPQFYGVIPGGQSFQIQQGTQSTVAQEGVGFDWIVPVRVGTTVMIVGGDDRGIGTAGSTTLTVQAGTNGVNNTCLTDSSPSSTAGTPAGGSYPTNAEGSSTSGNGSGSNGSGSGSSSSSGSNTGAIIGGAIGGALVLISALIIAFLFFLRRKRRYNKTKTRPVDLLQGDAEDPPPNGRSELPQFYQAEPFLIPDPTARESSFYDDDTSGGNDTYHRRQSTQTSMTTDFLRSGTPDGGGSSHHTRKSRLGPGQNLRPVNIIQHDDAGPPEQDTTQETIELPPAYNKIRRPLIESHDDDDTATTTADNATNPRLST